MRLITLPVCATALALAIAPQAMARDYGQHGTVWPVVEPDLLQQIHARLTQLEKTGETARLNEEHGTTHVHRKSGAVRCEEKLPYNAVHGHISNGRPA